MNTTATGKSILYNIVEILDGWEKSDQHLFQNYIRRQDDVKPKYHLLYKEICRKTQNEGLAADDINEDDFKAWAKGKSIVALNKLKQVLYQKILDFLAYRFKEREQEKWRVEVGEGLYAVQALMERRLYVQALAYLGHLEKKIPDSISWGSHEDLSFFIKIANLKLGILGHLDLAQEDSIELILRDLHILAREFPFYAKRAEQKKLIELADGKFQLLKVLIKINEEELDYDKQTQIIQKVQNFLSKRQSYFVEEQAKYAEQLPANTFFQLEAYFWQIHEFNVHWEHGNHHSALNALNKRRRISNDFDQSAWASASLVWLQSKMQNWEMATLILEDSLSDEEKLEGLHQSFAALWGLSMEEIKSLPLRLELNRILLFGMAGNHAAMETLTRQLIDSLSKPVDTKLMGWLKLLDTWAKLEQGYGKSYQVAKKTEDYFRNKVDRAFERSMASLLNTISVVAKNKRTWKTKIEKEAGKVVQKLKSTQDLKNPVHQFFMSWLQNVLLAK